MEAQSMPLPQEQRYTYADLLEWDDGTRYELIYGIPYMQAAPSRKHQKVIGEIFGQLRDYLKDKRCEAYVSPFAVRLFEEKEDKPYNVDTYVEPDIVVVCDPDKLDEAGCVGAPDLIIEVLSPTTNRLDRITKFNLYQQAGVKEYWLVDTDTKTVQVFTLADGHYQAKELYDSSGEAIVDVLDDCNIDLSQVFAW